MLAAVGLLVAGLVAGSATVQWMSFGVSSVAVLLLVLGELRRRRHARREDRPTGTGTRQRAGTADPGPEPVHRLPQAHLPPVPPTNPGLDTAGGATAASTWPSGPPSGSHARADAGPPTGARAHADGGPPTGAHARSEAGAPAVDDGGEPPVEEVEVTDLLLVLDLADEVLVVDEHPRYHLGRCAYLAGAQPVPLPMVEARTDGFTPCGACTPDRVLAQRERARRSA